MTCTQQSRLQMLLLLLILFQAPAIAATKPHTIAFGKWTTVQWSPNPSVNASPNAGPNAGPNNDKPQTLKIRPLMVDAHIKEFTLGPAHDVTDRQFVVRRAFRINDSLPQESAQPPHWQWQRGGWLLVDRVTGRISSLNLPEFDIVYSAVSWYRDYAAYCGVSDDGKKVYAVVAQISRRKAVLKKPLDESIPENATADSACPVPAWQRSPTRVAFEPAGTPKQTFAIRGHVVDLVIESEEPENEEASK